MSKSCGGACGGDATSAADTDIQASSEVPGRWVSVYVVPKMDCPIRRTNDSPSPERL